MWVLRRGAREIHVYALRRLVYIDANRDRLPTVHLVAE